MRSINYNIGLFAIVIFMLNLIDLRPFFFFFFFFFFNFHCDLRGYMNAEQTEGGSKER